MVSLESDAAVAPGVQPTDVDVVPAGEDGVRKITDIRPAAEIIEEMMVEADEILAKPGAPGSS